MESSTSNTNFAQVMNSTTARRKFNVLTEVRKGLGRFKHQTHGDWRVVPDSGIVKQITSDWLHKRLMVCGQTFTIPWTRHEVLSYITCLPPPVQKEEPQNRKLASTPVFYQDWVRQFPQMINSNQVRQQLPEYPGVFSDAKSMLVEYKERENYHKRIESHHPDGEGWVDSITSTMECVLDVYNSLLRTAGIVRAYEKLLEILATPKFDNLDPSGVYGALLHLHIRGVANSERLRNSGKWRERRSQEELYKLHLRFRCGDVSAVYKSGIMGEYHRETAHHVSTMNCELQRLRMMYRHDHTKFRPDMMWWYAWHWGVFANLNAVNKHRACSGCEQPIGEILHGQETMFSVGESIGSSLIKGAVKSPEFEQAQAEIKSTIKEAMVEASTSMKSDLEETLRAESQKIKAEATDLLGDLSTSLESLSDESLGRATSLVERLTNSMDSMTGLLNSIKSTVGGFFDQILGVFKHLPGMGNINLSFDGIFKAFVGYIIYQNTDSVVLRSLAVIYILNNLQLLKIGYTYLIKIIEYLTPNLETGSNTFSGRETSCSVFETLSGSFTSLVHVISAVIASIAKGSVLTTTEFWKLVEALAGPMRTFGAIGLGCLGLTRITTFVKNIYTVVVEWISTNIFGRTPEKEAMARKALILICKINYFDSEAGLNAIRVNQKLRKTAETIFAEWTALTADLRLKPEYKNILMDLERVRARVKNISDYITRLEAMSSFCPTMFHIQFVGQPGVGKSFLTKTFVDNISKTLWPEEKSSLYSYNPNLEFFDGYAGQRVFYMDDCFRMQEPKHLTTLIGLITNTPVILPMANLEDKGLQLTSDVMISSTNTAWPIGKDVLCMEAVHRRRHMLVEVKCDDRVRDPSSGAFSMQLYLKYYKVEDLPKFPHLTFNLLRPVPTDFSGAQCETTSTEAFNELQKYAQKLHDANVAIQTPGTRVTDPMFYFSDDNRPPEGIPLPCTGWKYEQLVHTFIARYRAFRGAECNYSTERKFLYAERAIAEIENLFTQQRDIVHPDAVEVSTDEACGPVYSIINKWMTDIQHPYGITDPIGERLVEDPELCPELDHVDFEAMVDKILAEGSTDSGIETSLTLDEDKERTRLILERKRRSAMDPVVREMLRVVQIDGKQHIRINSHYTFWDGIGLPEADNPHRKFIPNVWNLKEWRDFVTLQLIGALPDNSSLRTENALADALDEFDTEIERLIFAKDMYYPKKEIFGELQGVKSPFSLRWLQCLKKRGVDWYLDVSHMNLPHVFNSLVVRANRNGKEYLVPLDWAFLFSITSSFRMFCLSFDELTTEQQEVLVEEARWRNQYTGLFTLESVRQSCSSTILSGCIKTIEYVLSPMYYLCDKMPAIFHTIAAVSIFCVIIWMMKKIAGLILGKSSETSKYLHRGPQSHIKYHGRPTSAKEPIDSNMAWLDAILERNVRECTFSDSYAGATCQVLLSKQFLIMNAHVLRDLSEKDVIVTMRTPGTDGEYQRFMVPRDHFEVHPDGDLAVCWIRSLPMARDITHRLYTEQEFEKAEFTNMFYLLSRFNNKPSLEVHTYCRTAYKPSLILPNNKTSTIDRALILDGSTVVGKSGSAAMYLDHQSNMRLLGIQAWSIGRAYSPQVAVQIVTQELLTSISDRLIKRLGAQPVERLAEYDSIVSKELPGVFTSREYNQVVEEVSLAEALGEIGKSKFQTTPIASFMERDGVVPDSTPAALSHRDVRLVHPDHPLKHSVSKYVRGSVDCFDLGLLSYIRDGLGMWIKSKLDKRHFRRLCFDEIVTGTREDGSNPMNLSSSPGVPYVYQKREGKGKKQFFQISEEGQLEYYDPEILQEYTKFISCLRNRKLPLTRAYDFPKDELRPVSKALGTELTPPKTRSVTCMNMLYVLAWREVTLDFWASMHRAADGTFPFCPGINPEGPDWNAARRYLSRFEKVVDFDVSNWDGFLPADLLYLAGDIVADVSGLNTSDRNVVDSILHEVMNCYIQYGTHIYKKSRGMVSGFPGTAEMNSLVHWILLLYIYFYLTQNNPEFHSFEAFRANVSCLFYGDDVIISFSDEIAEIFNGITISQTYYSIGYPVTAADKSGEIRKFKRLEECSFLKSKWHPLCPSIFIRKMDKSVVHNLLYWVRAKEQPVEQFYTNLIDSLRIMFGHGEQAFREFVLELNGWLTDAGLEPILYTYRDLLDDHMRRYYSVNIFGY
nr:MAG: putative RNA-dependent RNA polymerase [Polycipiviridae sp.]